MSSAVGEGHEHAEGDDAKFPDDPTEPPGGRSRPVDGAELTRDPSHPAGRGPPTCAHFDPSLRSPWSPPPGTHDRRCQISSTPSLAGRLPRLVAELVVIIVGVLIALAGQSWWEARAVEEDRRRTLRLLHDDVTRLEASLRNSARADSVADAIQGLLAGRFAESDSALAHQVGDALWSFGFEIGARNGEDLLPAYADLKSSGRLALLPDTVRSRLPSIELQLSSFSSFLDDLVFHHQNRLDPILFESFELETASAGLYYAFSNPRQNLAVFRQREARNVLVLKWALIMDQLDRARATADSLRVISDLIESVREGR